MKNRNSNFGFFCLFLLFTLISHDVFATDNYNPTDNSGTVSGVSSFNTRTGAVTPASGDYSTFYLGISNNLSDLNSASAARTNLGLGTAAVQNVSVFLQTANNLSDVTATTARTNLGLGTAATQNTGTSGANIPFLNGNNTYSGNLTFSGTNSHTGTETFGPINFTASPSIASPTTHGFVITDTGGGTVNDTTGTGTVANEVINSFPPWTITSTSAMTITNAVDYYFQNVTCSTNVTCTNKYSVGAANGVYVAGGAVNVNNGTYQLAGKAVASTTAPTISSGFGTSPTITANNTMAFKIAIGSGGTASSGVVTMPTANAGWKCDAVDVTTQSTSVFTTRETAYTTTSVTFTQFNTSMAATAWTAGDDIEISCIAR